MTDGFTDLFSSLVSKGLLKEDHIPESGELAPSGTVDNSGNQTDRVTIVIDTDDRSTFKIVYLLLFGDIDDNKLHLKILLGESSRHNSLITDSMMSVPHPIFSYITPSSSTSIVLVNEDTVFYQPYDFTLLSYQGNLKDFDKVKECIDSYCEVHSIVPPAMPSTPSSNGTVPSIPTDPKEKVKINFPKSKVGGLIG